MFEWSNLLLLRSPPPNKKISPSKISHPIYPIMLFGKTLSLHVILYDLVCGKFNPPPPPYLPTSIDTPSIWLSTLFIFFPNILLLTKFFFDNIAQMKYGINTKRDKSIKRCQKKSKHSK